MALVVLYTADDELMANSVHALMLQNGIASMIRRTFDIAFEIIDPNLGGAWGEVLVQEADAERARELIAGFFTAEGQLLPTGELEDASDNQSSEEQ
jgi:hypothetical protein